MSHAVEFVVVDGEKFPSFKEAKGEAVADLTMSLMEEYPFLDGHNDAALDAFNGCENHEEIFNDYHSAVQFLKGKDYRRHAQACRYTLPAEDYVPTKQENELTERENRLRKEKAEYMEKHAIRNYSSTLKKHCPNCTADIPVKYVTDDKCPLCHTDLRSNTVKNMLKRYDERIRNAIDLRANIMNKRKDKMKKSMVWLFVADIYLG